MARAAYLVAVVGLLAALSGLTAELVRADVCAEPNDRVANACFLPAGATVQGTIDFEGDVDVYKIEVGGANYHIKLELLDLSSDCDLYLTTDAGNVLAQSVQEGLVAERLDIYLQLGGTYYAHVRSPPDRDFRPGSPYNLRLTLTPPSVPPTVAPTATPQLPDATATPLPTAVPAAPTPLGPPSVGGLRFGYNAAGVNAVASGGALPAAGETTLYVFVQWSNVPLGTPIKVELRKDHVAVGLATITVDSLSGARAVDFKNVGGDGYETIQVQYDPGNNTVVTREETRPITYYYELFCFIDGHQVANGWFQIN